jgi:hypothetical protein
MDKAMYAVLATVILLGLWNTATGSILNSRDAALGSRPTRRGWERVG